METEILRPKTEIQSVQTADHSSQFKRQFSNDTSDKSKRVKINQFNPKSYGLSPPQIIEYNVTDNTRGSVGKILQLPSAIVSTKEGKRMSDKPIFRDERTSTSMTGPAWTPHEDLQLSDGINNYHQRGYMSGINNSSMGFYSTSGTQQLRVLNP